ncbi:MAG: Z1 domain-containing protein [Actinobacteria bacterium]|nr:Z1 domain-containing protein [Actinomycetota bacterium]
MTPEMAPDFDGQYKDFLEEVDAFGPDKAAARLRRFGIPEETLRNLVEKFEHHAGVVSASDGPVYIQGGGRHTWYTGPRPGDLCWPALKTALELKWPAESVESLDSSSTRIVGLLEHPKTMDFHTKGLVLGHIQSGKTTNYTAAIAKAADRGYRFFVVLAGIHNELRRQTQSRLAQQLVEPNKPFWHQLTKEEHDFVPPANAQAFFSKYSEQAVLCVIKKNAVVLRKFIAWLEEAGTALDQISALIIDDEADQAAIATKTINPLIRNVLDVLPRAGYIGYTATPFANLLVDPSAGDLYPKDFVVDLEKPSDHFGTEVIFGRQALDGEDPLDADDGYDMVRIVPDDEVADVRPLSKPDVDGFIPDIGGELERAVRWFWLATAARRSRGGSTTHSTMLIHTSVRVAVHQSFRKPLEDLTRHTSQRWLAGDKALRDELRAQWQNETERVVASDFGETPVAFDELAGELGGVFNDTRIVLDNSASADRLDYRAGPQTAIAVGGNTLSRGLTLEGLVSSYFVRSSTAYDTLLQMGRWFGYRGGYADLPRVWMTQELRQWFADLAGVEAEIRRDIARYMSEDETPLTFAVRIRCHPALNVTAAAKMRDAVQVSGAYGGMRTQTRYFKADDPDWLARNKRAAYRLVAQAKRDGKREEDKLLWRDVPAASVLDFLSSYRIHDLSADSLPGLLSGYIEKRIDDEALRLWNIAVIDNGTGPEFDFGGGIIVPTVVRAKLEQTPPSAADIKTLMSRKDATLDLDVPEGPLTEDDIRAARRAQLPRHGLLVLYPIDRISQPARKKNQRRERLDAVDDPVGVGLVFPQPEGEDAIAYVSADLSKVTPAIGYVEDEDMGPVEEDNSPVGSG